MMMLDNSCCVVEDVCSCEPFACFCECGCEGCLIQDSFECPCGGNCGCGNQN